MSQEFQIIGTGQMNGVSYYSVKECYMVRVGADGKATCDCMGDTFRQGGRKQQPCKHIRACLEFSLKFPAKGCREWR